MLWARDGNWLSQKKGMRGAGCFALGGIEVAARLVCIQRQRIAKDTPKGFSITWIIANVSQAGRVHDVDRYA